MQRYSTNNDAASSSRSATVQGVWTIADQAVVSLTSFVATVIVGRTLGSEQLGVFALGGFAFWLLAGVVNAVVWVPYTARACRLNGMSHTRYLANATLMAVALAAGLSLMCLLAGLLAGAVVPVHSWIPPFCFALAPLTFTLMLREHVRRVCIADFRSFSLLLLDVPIGLLVVGSLSVLATLQRLSPVTAILATALGAALSLPLVWRLVSRVAVTPTELLTDIRSNWGFGRWMLVVALARLMSDGSLRWMLAAIYGMHALGVFSAAFAVVMLVNPLLLAMTSFTRSWAARVLEGRGTNGLLAHTVRGTLVAVLLAVGAMSLLARIGEQAVVGLFGADFANQPLVLLLAASICLQAAAIPVESALTAMELGRRMTNVSLVQLAATILVGAPLVFAQGPMGIAWAMIARSVPLHVMCWETVWKSRNFAPSPALASQAGV